MSWRYWHDLENSGYHVDNVPETARELLRLIDRGAEGIAVEDYARAFEDLPEAARAKVVRDPGAFLPRDGRTSCVSALPRLRLMSRSRSPLIGGRSAGSAFGLVTTPPLPPRSRSSSPSHLAAPETWLPRADPCRCPWPPLEMAARQDGGAVAGCFPPRSSPGGPARHLSLYRLQSRRGCAGQAAHRRRYPSAICRHR